MRDALVGDVGEADAIERAHDALLALRRIEPDQSRGVAKIVGRRHVVVEADRVWQIADVAFDFKRLADRIAAQHTNRTARDLGQAQHHQDGGGLAGAVRPEQAEDLAAPDSERNSVHRHGAAVALGQALGLDDGIAHRRPNRATAPTRINSAMPMMPTPATPHNVEVETATRYWVEAVSPRDVAVKDAE